jgi:hypothetical protein
MSRPMTRRRTVAAALAGAALAASVMAVGCTGSNTAGPTNPPVVPPVAPPAGQLTPTVPTTYNGRCVDVQGTVTVSSRQVTFQVWDDGTVDGDIISLIVNGTPILSQFTLDGPANKRSVPATLSNDGYNYVILYAHNEGSIPPNTAALSISDGRTSQDIEVSANLVTNGAYNIIVGSAPPPPPRPACPVSPTTPTQPPPSATTAMTWSLTDACNDGRGIQVRFFDKTNNLVWPPDNTQVYVAGQNGTVNVSLAAQAGAKICYGAQPDPPNNRYWGVGIDGNSGCTDCCYTAAATTVRLNLACP